MKRLAIVTVLALSPWLLVAPRTVAGDFAVDADELAAALREVRPEVERETGVDLADLSVRIGTREEVTRALLAELVDQFTAALGDEDAARRQGQALSRLLAPALLAKYAWSEKTVFVVPENFVHLSTLIDEPALRTPAGLRAVLTHELVHAADDRRFDFGASLRRCRGQEALECFSAVIEGHAQVLARRISARREWTAGFDALTRSIDKVPENLAEGEKQFARILSAKLVSAYLDGEVFMKTLEKEGGAEAVVRAFRETPSELALIDNPGWYLDPTRRPARTYDLTAALGALEERYDEGEWKATATSMTKGQLRAALGLLSPEDLQWLLGAIRDCRALVLQPRAAPDSKMIAAALYEFPSPADAERFQALMGDLARTKDEKMRTGAIRIVAARYEPIAGERWSGELTFKVVAAGPQTVPVGGLTARRGAVGLELVYSGLEVEADRIREEAAALFDAVFVAGTGEEEGD